MIRRRNFNFASVVILAATCARSAPSADELALHDKLLDLFAIVKTVGISFVDYQKVIAELVVLKDRYIRRGGEVNELTEAADEYIEALTNWKRALDIKHKIGEANPNSSRYEEYAKTMQTRARKYSFTAR